MKHFIKDGHIDPNPLYHNGKCIINPTADNYLAAGFEEYTPPQPTPYIPTYKELVVQYIRERYDGDDEFAILRQRDTKPQEFAEYNAYCEECKQRAKADHPDPQPEE